MINLSRLRIATSTIGSLFLVIVIRFFYWQIIKYPDYTQNIINQRIEPSIITPQIGQIFDIHHFPLALNQNFYELSIYKPELRTDLKLLTNSLIGSSHPALLRQDIENLSKFTTNNAQKWLTLKTKFPRSEAPNFVDPGIKLHPIQARVYPEGNTGLPLILGLEKYYQKTISGRSGYSWNSIDAVGNVNFSKAGWYIEAKDGQNITTTIDRRIQYIAEEQLQSGLVKFSADSGSIIIMSPASGDIIALTSMESSPSARKISAITDLFEPGSIFKPLVMAAALNESTITPEYICSECDRPHRIGEYAISNWDSSFHPRSTIYDIIKNSDNIGMSYIIETLGKDRFSRYFSSLGLDRRTDIDLPGEAYPLKKSYFPDIDLATASFGQGFAITQIQMITAFNTLANQGVLVRPRLTVARSDRQPDSIYTPSTISQIKNILKYAVENGSVAKFKPKSLDVCAKSGTAQIAVKGGYSESSTIASYIGFSPCDHPKFTMIVTINNPRTSPWGSSTAAPVWFEIADKINLLL